MVERNVLKKLNNVLKIKMEFTKFFQGVQQFAEGLDGILERDMISWTPLLGDFTKTPVTLEINGQHVVQPLISKIDGDTLDMGIGIDFNINNIVLWSHSSFPSKNIVFFHEDVPQHLTCPKFEGAAVGMGVGELIIANIAKKTRFVQNSKRYRVSDHVRTFKDSLESDMMTAKRARADDLDVSKPTSSPTSRAS
jgi:hypothetical protein